jgi:hypothetical protein
VYKESWARFDKASAKRTLRKIPNPSLRFAMNDLEVRWWPTEKPIPYARNSRKIPERAIDKVAASIQEFGWQQCMVGHRSARPRA